AVSAARHVSAAPTSVSQRPPGRSLWPTTSTSPLRSSSSANKRNLDRPEKRSLWSGRLGQATQELEHTPIVFLGVLPLRPVGRVGHAVELSAGNEGGQPLANILATAGVFVAPQDQRRRLQVLQIRWRNEELGGRRAQPVG